MSVRRKPYRVLFFVALVAAFVVPVDFALSLESGAGQRNPLPETATAPAAMTASIVAPRSSPTGITRPFSHPVSDPAKLLIVGTVLIGLAAALRRAS